MGESRGTRISESDFAEHILFNDPDGEVLNWVSDIAVADLTEINFDIIVGSQKHISVHNLVNTTPRSIRSRTQ